MALLSSFSTGKIREIALIAGAGSSENAAGSGNIDAGHAVTDIAEEFVGDGPDFFTQGLEGQDLSVHLPEQEDIVAVICDSVGPMSP